MKEKQAFLWEDEIPEWLIVLDRLDEVDIGDADSNFLNDIESDYEKIKSINLVDEAKKFVYYWSGARKLGGKGKRKGSWKLGWRNWLDRQKRNEIKYGRVEEGSAKDRKGPDYGSKEHLQEARRRQEQRRKIRESKSE